MGVSSHKGWDYGFLNIFWTILEVLTIDRVLEYAHLVM